MSGAFVSHKRRVRFELTLRIIDLNNVPLVSGTSFIEWHLPSSTAAEHRGRTNKCAIRDHRVAYDYESKNAIRLTLGKDGMLQECMVHFDILQEYSASGRGERIRLGQVKLNLAEYVDASESQGPMASNGAASGETSAEGVTRRYLMQDSKINSTLKVGIHMRYIEGTRDYYAPALKTAPVFGGIAGIISSSEPVNSSAHGLASSANNEQQAADASLPNFSSNNKEIGEMQDMYRRSLAAFLFSQPGELKAEDAIEDIFNGGDGWGKHGKPESLDQRGVKSYAFGDESRPGSGTNTPKEEHSGSRPKSSHASRDTIMGMSMGRRRHHKNKSEKWQRMGLGEVDESDVQEDLRSWRSWRIGDGTEI